VAVVRWRSDELSPEQLRALRRLFDAAWPPDDVDGPFTDEDFQHALGGVHLVVLDGDVPVSHASVVERELHADGRPLRTGYVEAVATAPAHHGHGHGTRLMETVAAILHERYELGALGTGSHHFYERLGWRVWRGPTAVRLPDGGERPTPDEDRFILVLRTPATPANLDDQAPLSCGWRPGDVW